jgi:diguanylate cyclase (GGDEF)-like protein/PAS domain S-box-containing protein
MAAPNSLPEDQNKHPFTVPPATWPGQISIGHVALGVGLVAGALSLLFVVGVGDQLQGSHDEAIHALLELLIVVGATHVVSVCTGLWLSYREPRWLVLAVGFAIVSTFYIGHLIHYTNALPAQAELIDTWAWAQESVVCVVLLVSVWMVAAQRVSVRTAVLAAAGLVALSAITLLVPGQIQDVAGGGNVVPVFNAVVCLVALGYVSAKLRTRARNGALVMLGAATVLELLAQLSDLVTSNTYIDTSLGYALRFFAFAAIYYGLFVLGLLRPYRYARHAEEFFRTLVASSPAGIALTRAGRILHANQAFLDLTGFESLDKAREAYIWDLDAQDSGANEHYHLARERGDRNLPNTVVRRLAARDGRMVHARVEHADVEMPDGRATLTYFIDFSKTVEAQEELQRMANYDALTGLPNRALLRGQLEQALRVAGRIGDLVAVLFIDLDQFKQVNDTLGHASGDELLKMVAHRLQGVCRKEDMLGRLGGDEFLVIGQHIRSRNGASTLAAKLIQALDTPFDLEGHKTYVGGSIGISTFPNDGEDASTLIRNADVAMYHAKRGGGPRVAFYEEEMNARALERLELGTELRWALDREEFELFYQPRVDLKTGRIAGAEALLRWRSPVRGLVLPDRFVPILEESGLIIQLGRQVLAKACHAAMGWRSEGFGRIPVAVNLSAAQFRGSVVEDIELALSASGLPHEDLELEITESLLFRDYEQARVPLEKLTAKGIRSALDDFGTGYSSLSSLHNLPVHFVKIDRSFVQALQPGRNTIVAAIINVAHTLSMQVIAEGVETVEQRDLLIELGCDEMQGHLFAPAMSEKEFVGWLRTHRKPHLIAVSDDK